MPIKRSVLKLVPAPPAPGLWLSQDGKRRCSWCRASASYVAYHDNEWGQAETDDRALFEKLCLEGFQAGLSWLTILNKRDSFRHAFADFDAATIAHYGAADVGRLMTNANIVRHRGKIESTINNARRMLELQDEFGSLCTYTWLFEPHHEMSGLDYSEAPARALADEAFQLSADLKRRGWTFVGPTTMYAFMQAMGLVNDHLHGCEFRAAASKTRRALEPSMPTGRDRAV